MSIAVAGAYGSAWIADKIKSARDGEKRTDAVDGMYKIAPMAAAIQTSAHTDKTLKGASYAKDFIEGAVLPGPPAMTKSALAGYTVKKIYDEVQERK